MHILLVFILSKFLNMCLMKVQMFQMANNNSGIPGGSGGDFPPPPPMTPNEAFIAAQTEVLRQILQTQQVIAQRLQQIPQYRNQNDQVGVNAVTKYEHFRAMRPPEFSKADEPLEADAFIRALEAKF